MIGPEWTFDPGISDTRASITHTLGITWMGNRNRDRQSDSFPMYLIMEKQSCFKWWALSLRSAGSNGLETQRCLLECSGTQMAHFSQDEVNISEHHLVRFLNMSCHSYPSWGLGLEAHSLSFMRANLREFLLIVASKFSLEQSQIRRWTRWWFLWALSDELGLCKDSFTVSKPSLWFGKRIFYLLWR